MRRQLSLTAWAWRPCRTVRPASEVDRLHYSYRGHLMRSYSKDDAKDGKLFNKTVFNRFLSICLPLLSLSTMILIPTLKHFSTQKVERHWFLFRNGISCWDSIWWVFTELLKLFSGRLFRKVREIESIKVNLTPRLDFSRRKSFSKRRASKCKVKCNQVDIKTYIYNPYPGNNHLPHCILLSSAHGVITVTSVITALRLWHHLSHFDMIHTTWIVNVN